VLAVVAVGALLPVLRGSGPSGVSGPTGSSRPAAPADALAAAAGSTTPEPTRTAAAIPGLDRLAPATTARPRPSTSADPAPARPAVASVRKGASIWKSAGMAAALRDSGVSWFYTWGADSKGVSAPGVEFVPMIWGAANADAATLARATAAGRTLLGFNEPDLAGQAEMSVDTALSLWPKLQATGLRLGAPAVAAGADKAGGWLDGFMTGVAARGYRVDFIPLHWYGGDFRAGPATDQLEAYVSAVRARYHKPIWITEYALMRFDGGTKSPTAAAQSAFVGRSTAMLRTLPYVERYAWFSLAAPDEGGDGTGLYRPDGTRTPAGAAYRAAS
jgi:Glycosyl hydrolase catalytic core